MKIVIGAVIGVLAGALVGFVGVLLVFGILTGGAQSGLAAILFGVPLGAIAGGVIGAMKAGAKLDDILGVPKG